MRKVPLRLMLMVIPLALLGAGMVEWARRDPAFITEGGANGLQVGLRLAGFTEFGGGFSVGFLPFWATACLVVGLVSLILLYAVGDLKDTLRWSAPLLLLLWVLQLATIVGIYPQGPNTEGPPLSFSYWLTRSTYIGAKWWGLVLLLLMVVAIAVGSRMRRVPQRADSALAPDAGTAEMTTQEP